MKFKTTAKNIRDNFPNVRSAGYCDLQHLLYNHSPIAYTCGVYGWNFDVYNVYGVTICTGYRGMPGKRLEAIADYDRKASQILSWENQISHEQKKEQVEALLQKFCELNGGRKANLN